MYGMVVDPGCMKCMDCVSVCPNDCADLFRLWKAAARRKFLTTNRTDSKAKPVRGIFDIVVDAPVRVGLAEITWSFFSLLAIQAKKHFWQTLALARAPGKQARGAEAELDEPSAKGWTLVME